MANKHLNHQDASRIPRNVSLRVINFKSLEEKAHWLDAASSLDALRTGLQDVARRFTSQRDPELRTRAIHRFVRDKIHYEHDFRVSTGQRGEEFADPPSAIKRGYGDCDDKARMFVALMRAAEIVAPLGTQARIRAVFTKQPKQFVHVQAEAKFPGSLRVPGVMPDGWVLAELILKGCELGQNPEDVPLSLSGEKVLA
jgi:transglutaminase-like putative cysteine protease